MATLKDLRVRINSVQSTQKITKAMQMVAAAKLRRAQEAAESARPYAERMESVLASLASGMAGQDDAPKLLAGTGSDNTHLIVVATSERGLCGGFNSSIVRAVKKQVSLLVAEGKTVKLLVIGKKGRDQLQRDYSGMISETVDHSDVKKLAFSDAAPIGRRIIEMFDAGEFDICTVYYNRFASVISQIVTAQQLIPAALPVGDDGENLADQVADDSGAIYEYEPDEKEILEDLLPRNISVQLYRALLENAASEQGARMSAMDAATRNAGELIDKLTLNYNRTRQAVITSELIEIISGAEAI